MSLISFVQLPEVIARFKPLRPKLQRMIGVRLKVAPRTKRYMLVGTAFDYLLRFEIQRRAPHAKTKTWVAELAPDRIWRQGFYLHLPSPAGPGEWGPPDELGPPDEMEAAAKGMSDRMRAVVEKARAAVGTYTQSRSPTPPAQADLAGHAIRLAKLDDVFRALRIDPQFEDADPEDVQDLLALLAVVPWSELVHDKVLLLNPTFGESSGLVGGADADLIAGDALVDFKTTKAGEVTAAFLDQLLGYSLLVRHQRRIDPAFPEIKRLGLYFCRHGHLWVQDASLWASHPDFAEVERWFFDHAKEVCVRTQKPGPAAEARGQLA
jgi:hypothetical protein